MNAPQVDLKLDNPKPQRDGRLKPGRLKILGAIFGLALMLFAAMHWPQRNSDAARVTEATPGSESQAPSTPFEYFPAQYHNHAQSASPEEHIQAF